MKKFDSFDASTVPSEGVVLPLVEYPLIFTQGGDDRLPLDPETGTNKYHCKPNVLVDKPFRGSCTCNTPTQLAFNHAKEYYNKLKSEEITVEEVMQEVRDRLVGLYDLPENTGVFLTPSGSDAEYIPLLIAKILNKGKKVNNIVTCNEEVGSGTLDAAGGRFFSDLEPIPGFTEAYAQDGVQMSDDVFGLAENVTTFPIDARKVDGEVNDTMAQIKGIIKDCKKNREVPIVHSVFGSKTGI